MNIPKRPLAVGIALSAIVFLGACAAEPDTNPQVGAEDATTPSAVAQNASEAEPAANPTATLAQLPLTNAKTGESFTLADYSGQTVLVKPMATWCGKCKANLQAAREATTELNSDNLVVVALSVEDSLENAKLAQYASDEGFDFVFAVATPEMTRALDARFGQTALNPSIGSRFIIAPNGEISELTTGKVDPASLVTTLKSVSDG
ncbi:MAG: TlpA disulfide reductase family protein [Geitlerinemataceae cyanobacterium]